MITGYRALIAALALAACSLAPTGPGPTDGPLRMEAAIGRPILAVGDTTDLVFRLLNTSAQSVTLDFPSSCEVLPYIRVADSDQVAYPTGGGWGCYPVLSQLTIPAHDAHVVRVSLRGGAPQRAIYPETPIGVGRYVATAEVISSQYHLRSAPVAFTVR